MAAPEVESLGNEYVLVLGKIVISAGQLEEITYWIARHLRVKAPDPRRALKQIVKDVRDQIDRGMPPWSEVEAQSVHHWLTHTVSLMEARNRIFHSAAALQFDGEKWRPVAIATRDGTRTVPDQAHVDGLLGEMNTQIQVGFEIWTGLLYPLDGGPVPIALYPMPGIEVPENALALVLASLPPDHARWLEHGTTNEAEVS